MSIAQNYPNLKPSLSLNFAQVKALDPRVSFSRASSATYYGTETAKAEENLFLRSQEFDNASWLKINVTVTANTTTAPDGTTTAENIVPTASNVLHLTSQNIVIQPTVPATLSVYAKASGYDFIALFLGTGSASVGRESFQVFDLSTGTVATSYNTAPTSASIVDVGDGWYRCSVTWSHPTVAINSESFWPVPSDQNPRTAYTGDGTSGVFLWGAQLEQRSSVTAYTPTTDQPITRYQPVLESVASNVARFDHDPITGESLGLLIEESRTNLVLRSEEFDDAGWTKTNATVTANTVIAPDGTLTGDTITATTDSSNVRVAVGTTNVIHVNSIWLKRRKGTGTVRLYNPFGQSFTDITSTLTTQWQRFSSLATLPFNGPLSFVGVLLSASGDEVDVWGAQCEIGSFATSYIKTVASQVTRAADAASMTGANFSSWYRQDAGTLFGEAKGFGTGTTGSNALFQIDNGSSNNRVALVNDDVTAVGGLVVVGGVTQAAFTGSFNPNYNKGCLAYKTNDIAYSLNGSTTATDTTALLPVVNRMIICSNAAGTSNHTIKKLSYYPARLTNEQLQALTS